MSLDLNVLNPEQRNAVEQMEGPCMIIAGAGSGKTRVLTYKIAHLINSGISPFEILALTFTNKAASEMKDRIADLAGDHSQKIWMGTFHSIFARMLRVEAEKLGFTRNFTIYDSDDSVSLVRQIMLNIGIPTENPSPKAIHSYISNLKNKLILPQEFSMKARTFFEQKVDMVYEPYQKSLQKNNAMDFDDLLIKPIELFNAYEEVLENYSDRFKFILVDEYQDTNRAQYLIVKMLSSKHKNISVVGDDAQSIYKWRGAEIQNIFDFESDYPERKLFRLEQNYRSTKKILALADDVIKKNTQQISKELWTENDDGEPVKMMETMTDRDEALRVTRCILDEMQKKKLNFKDFVVLYRTNAQSRLLEDSLRDNRIPYIIVGGVRFYQRREIKDILCHFKVIVNPRDNEALIRVLNLKEGIGKTTIDRLKMTAESEGVQMYDVLKNKEMLEALTPKIRNKLLWLTEFVHKYTSLGKEMGLSEVARSVIDEVGILRALKVENTLEADERINNVQELISAIAEFDDTAEEPTLESFLQEVSLVADIDTLDDKKNAVTLMTIHSAKGLEFPVVFVTGLEEGLFPVGGATLQEEELEEERRLFYVAITRAEQKLYLSHANQRYRYGTPSYQMKSRFIKEISEHISEAFEYDGLNLKSGYVKPKSGKPRASQPNAIRYEYYGSNGNGNGSSNGSSSRKKSYNFENDDKFPDVRKGVHVTHSTYGKGTVLSTDGRGLDKRAEIYFDDVGLKKIILKYAKMTIQE
jgi:DNA helicase-2/ATP-dependent DNA helicase PcrA